MIYEPPSQNAIQKTLDAQLLSGITASMTLNNVTGIQNKPGVCVVDLIDANGNFTPSKREYISFTGVSGSTLTGLTRNADGGGSDQDHAVGAIVQFPADVIQQQAIIDTLEVEHNLDDGKHTDALVTTLKATGAVVNTGTSDVTIVTPKALADSDYAKTSDITVTPDSTTTFSNKTYSAPIFTGDWTGLISGWINPSETWEYVSVDDPTGIFKVNADVTTKYSAGMRIKFTNGGNVIYGIITKVGTYGGDLAGYTYITFLHQIDPTDSLALYLMANSAITLNYYSTQKAPFGFPLETNKWTVYVTSNATKSVTSPDNTYKQIGDLALTIPIGYWIFSIQGILNYEKTALAYVGTYWAFSTATNSVSDTKLQWFDYTDIGGDTGNKAYYRSINQKGEISTTSKTVYYPIGRGYDTNISILALKGDFGLTQLKVTCAYL